MLLVFDKEEIQGIWMKNIAATKLKELGYSKT
jgi:uncharacterized membrane protein (UPF0127 family)